MTTSHIDALKKKREAIKKEIHAEACHAACNDAKIKLLKLQNLQLKQQQKLHMQEESGRSANG